MTPQETAKILVICSVAFPQYPVSKESITLYHELLIDLEYSEVERAVKELLLTTDRWITVAQIRKTVAQNNSALAPDRGDAWIEVNSAIKSHGRYQSPQWSHQAVAGAVKIIGWWGLCMSENQETLRSQFWKVYDEQRQKYDHGVLTTPNRLKLSQQDSNKLILEG
jgi:hypothetical protein